ncbi:unnamed protein product [Agarophyton chilense]
MLEIMSSGTRAQQAQVHERLLRRAQNFQPSLRQAHVLRQVALGTLQDYRADATFVQEEVANSIRNKVPSINSFLEEEYLASPTYPIPLLRDIATFYGCLAMPALETVQDKFVATSPLRQFCWILITLNEVPMEDLNDLVMMIVPLRQAPLPQIAAKLHSASTRVIEATVQAAGPARSEGSERRIAPEHGRLPPRKHDLQLQPEANRPPNSIREGNRPTGQMKRQLCESDTHLQREHSEALKRETRSRLASQESAVHIISDLVNDLGSIGNQEQDMDDEFTMETQEPKGNSGEGLQEVLHLFDKLTSTTPENSDESNTDAVNAFDLLQKVDEEALTYHTAGGMGHIIREKEPHFQ